MAIGRTDQRLASIMNAYREQPCGAGTSLARAAVVGRCQTGRLGGFQQRTALCCPCGLALRAGEDNRCAPWPLHGRADLSRLIDFASAEELVVNMGMVDPQVTQALVTCKVLT